MASYLPPNEFGGTINSTFNTNDFVSPTSSGLSLNQAKTIFVQKIGDTMSGNLMCDGGANVSSGTLQVNGLSEDVATSFGRLWDEIGSLHDTDTSQASTIDSINSTIATQGMNLTTLSNKVDSAIASTSSQTATITGLQNQITPLNATVNSHTGSIGTINTQVGTLQSNMSTQQQASADNTAKITTINTSSIPNLQQQIDDIKTADLGFVTTGTLNSTLGNYETVQAFNDSISNYATSGSLSALATTVNGLNSAVNKINKTFGIKAAASVSGSVGTVGGTAGDVTVLDNQSDQTVYGVMTFDQPAVFANTQTIPISMVTNLSTRLSTIGGNISTNTTSISAVQAKTQGIEYDSNSTYTNIGNAYFGGDALFYDSNTGGNIGFVPFVENTNATLGQLQTAQSDLYSVLNSDEATVAAIGSHISSLDASLNTLGASITALNTNLTNLETMDIVAINASLNSLQSSTNANSSAITTINARLPTFLTASALSPYALTSSLSSYVLSSNLATTLSGYVNMPGLATALSPYALSSALSNYVNSSSLTTTLSPIQTKQTADGTTIASHTTSISSLNSQMTTANSNISTLQTKQTADETTIGSHTTSITNLQTAITGISYSNGYTNLGNTYFGNSFLAWNYVTSSNVDFIPWYNSVQTTLGSVLTTASLTPYVLTSTLSSYLTTSTAASTYATITSVSTHVSSATLTSTLSSYLTTSTAASTYATLSSLSSYVTSATLTSTLSSYLTTAAASSTYATLSSLSSYVTSATLSSTLGSYLTTATASSTYATIASLASYTTTAALTTLLASKASLGTAQTWTATQTFSNITVTGNSTLGTSSANTLTVNSTPTFVSGLTVSSGTVSFPSSSIPSTCISGLSSGGASVSAANTWSSAQTFSGGINTSNITSSLASNNTTVATTSTAQAWVRFAYSTDNTKIIGITTSSGIYKSTDSGLTWTQVYSTVNVFNCVSCDQTCTNIIVTYNNGTAATSGAITSTNGGSSWTTISGANGLPSNIWTCCVVTNDGTTMRWVLGGQGSAGDGASSNKYINITTTPNSTWYGGGGITNPIFLAMCFSATNLIASVSGGNLYLSTTYGYDAWSTFQTGLPTTVNYSFLTSNITTASGNNYVVTALGGTTVYQCKITSMGGFSTNWTSALGTLPSTVVWKSFYTDASAQNVVICGTGGLYASLGSSTITWTNQQAFILSATTYSAAMLSSANDKLLIAVSGDKIYSNIVNSLASRNLLNVVGNLNLTGDVASIGGTSANSLTINSTASFKAPMTIYQMYETANLAPVSASVPTLNYALGSVFHIYSDQVPSSNFSVVITNIPFVSSATAVQTYTITLVYTTALKVYCNNVRVSDTASTYISGTSSTYATPLYVGGAPTLSSSNAIIQTFLVITQYTSAAVQTRKVLTTISSYY